MRGTPPNIRIRKKFFFVSYCFVVVTLQRFNAKFTTSNEPFSSSDSLVLALKQQLPSPTSRYPGCAFEAFRYRIIFLKSHSYLVTKDGVCKIMYDILPQQLKDELFGGNLGNQSDFDFNILLKN
jgi:hypothetical protein